MDAVLKRYGAKKILDITYSTAEATGHDWAAMVDAAKIICGVGDERVQVMFSQVRTREVMREGR